MTARDTAVRTRVVQLHDALAQWAAGLSGPTLAAATPQGEVGVLVERIRYRGAGAGGRAPRDLLLDEVLTVADADALARALPENPPPVPRASRAAAVRTSLSVLAERHPGRLIEVRVPPWGAVQIGRPEVASVHRRGTPPNVVETDAATWLRLVTGRTTWDDAVAAHAVSASGAHAQLRDLLPLA